MHVNTNGKIGFVPAWKVKSQGQQDTLEPVIANIMFNGDHS